jgi:hypothetical protein
MDDKFLKYSKLYFFIFLLFVSVQIAIGIIIALLYGFSSLISSRITDLLFELGVIAIPPAIFASAHLIFFKRTGKNFSLVLRTVSKTLFVIGLLSCIACVGFDIYYYFYKKVGSLLNYTSFSLLFLAGNCGVLFFIAVAQALSTPKEIDWMEKRRVADLHANDEKKEE